LLTLAGAALLAGVVRVAIKHASDGLMIAAWSPGSGSSSDGRFRDRTVRVVATVGHRMGALMATVGLYLTLTVLADPSDGAADPLAAVFEEQPRNHSS